MTSTEQVSFVVASLAAASALLNSLVGLHGFWRDNRRLRISVTPTQRDEDFIAWDVKLRNLARTSNSIAALQCFIDGKEFPQLQVNRHRENVGFYDEIRPFSLVKVTVIVAINRADFSTPPPDLAGFTTLDIRISPVRGPSRRFRFRQTDLPMNALPQ
jgi:hypothetical protein